MFNTYLKINIKKALLLLFFYLSWTTNVLAKEKLLIFAAASTTSAISDIVDQFNQENPNIDVKTSFASSSTLAKQIEAGAPAHVYISANPNWMDYLENQKLISPKTRTNLVSNALILVTPKGKNIAIKDDHANPLSIYLKEDKFCLGETSHVPAGMYAKQALTHLGWWEALKSSMVGTKDVKAVLAMVERGECAAGVVYSTDLTNTTNVQPVYQFPFESHDPILYPAATITNASSLAVRFINYLQSSKAQAVFSHHGFIVN